MVLIVLLAYTQSPTPTTKTENHLHNHILQLKITSLVKKKYQK